MGKKILDSKALYIFLSILISIVLWFYVTSLDGNEQTEVIRIPISYTGVDILEERGLMIVGNTPTATIEVRATPSVLTKLNSDTVTATVNVSQITEASEYRLAYTTHLPTGVSQSDVEFVSGQTGNVTFNVVRFISREVEIRGEFTGSVAAGYLAGDEDEFIFAPKTMTISGQIDYVNQVDHVLVSVGGDNLSDTVQGEFAYELIGVDGEPLTDIDVTCSDETVYVTYPIYATAEVPLKVDFIAGGGASESTIKYTMSSTQITVAGTKEAIAAIEGASITVATIDLADVRSDMELEFTIPLADELTNISGITGVTVSIDLPDYLITQTIDVNEFSFINRPKGWTANPVTQVLSVEVRGREDLLAALTAENIRVVADLAEINPAAGQYTVPVKIYVDSVGSASEVGVMGTEYKVVISLVEGEPVQQGNQTT